MPRPSRTSADRGINSARLSLGLAVALSTLAAPPARAAILSDSWFTSTIGGKRIGYLHEIRESDVEGGRKVVRTSLDTELALRRMGTALNVRSTAVFIETLEGEPLRFESTNRFAENDYSIRAERRGDVFLVTQEAMGKKTETEVPYAADILFPNAVERQIVERGLKEGARLELRTFAPDTARPTRTVIECKRVEEIELEPGRRASLLRFESTQDVLPDVILTEWRDRAGVVQKTSLPLLGIEIVSLRSTREQALLGPESVELLISTLVDPGYELPRPRDVSRARYKLTLRDPGTGAGFTVPEDVRQRIIGKDKASVLIEVNRESWTRHKGAPRPDPSYLRSSTVLQSDDPRVRSLAQNAGKGSEEEVAKAINAWVNRSIEKKTLSVGLATAAEVAKNLTGDCTEHAVLAAAMGRARGLPTQVAMGLIYTEGVFGYHMWTEVWDDGWHALDPAFGQAAADATHIKLAESSLEQGFIDDGLLGLVRLISNLGIEIVEYEIDGRVYNPRAAAETGSISERTYANGLYGLKFVAPKRWQLLPRRSDGDKDVLVRLEGPSGERGELRAATVAQDFRLSDWADLRPADRAVTRDLSTVIADTPGRRVVLEQNGVREGVLAFRKGDTLFTLRVRPLGLKGGDAALDSLSASIEVKQ
jgi:hypothetical protein